MFEALKRFVKEFNEKYPVFSYLAWFWAIILVWCMLVEPFVALFFGMVLMICTCIKMGTMLKKRQDAARESEEKPEWLFGIYKTHAAVMYGASLLMCLYGIIGLQACIVQAIPWLG